MGDGRKWRDRRKKDRRRPGADAVPSEQPTIAGVEVFGWTILAHPLFLQQIEKLAAADDQKHWFCAKTGNGRYRLFSRFQSTARIIVYCDGHGPLGDRGSQSGCEGPSRYAKVRER